MAVSDEIATRIVQFKKIISERGIEQAYAEHIRRHDCSILGQDFERSLRSEVAAHFGVPIDDVCLVGSAKLGFSPKPGQYFKPFSDNSDIDIAIVCRDLFARIWHEVAEMESAREYLDYAKFKHYHFWGWIRPDKMPSSKVYATSQDWWEFFQELSGREEFMRMKIRAGLYHDHAFLKRYQLGALLGLKENLERSGA